MPVPGPVLLPEPVLALELVRVSVLASAVLEEEASEWPSSLLTKAPKLELIESVQCCWIAATNTLVGANGCDRLIRSRQFAVLNFLAFSTPNQSLTGILLTLVPLHEDPCWLKGQMEGSALSFEEVQVSKKSAGPVVCSY